MQVLNRYSDLNGDLTHDFGAKVSISAISEVDEKVRVGEAEESKMTQEFEEKIGFETPDEDEADFSFICGNPISLISAEDAFQDGKIRPIYPVLDQSILFSGGSDEKFGLSLRPPLKKLFVEEERDTVAVAVAVEGPYCEWSPTVVEASPSSPQSCKKSSSTGFSRRWRFRNLIMRSNSDGKDAFVFLNASSLKANTNEKEKKKDEAKEKTAKAKANPDATSLSAAHEKLYGESKARKEGERRRSFLPYRQAGFFTNVNGLTRNVHPY